MSNEDKILTAAFWTFGLAVLLSLGQCTMRTDYEAAITKRACIAKGHTAINGDCIPPAR